MSLLGNIWVKLGLKSDDFNRGIDNAEKKTSKFGKAMSGIAARVLSVAAAFKVLASSFRVIRDFEAAQSKLASVLGTTADKIGALTTSARALGSRTQYTASQVSELQTELAKLGFTSSEIMDMQEGVLKFAAAVGTDLASAAARAGATMRGFGLTAKETNDMLAVLAVSTSKSALSFNYLDSSLGKLVPVTKAYGFDARDTITLLGTLANMGIDASSAGTALRRVFAELAKEDSKLNKALGGQPKTMEALIEGLKKLKSGGMGVKESFELVGKYAGPAFAALVAGADNCEALYGELKDVNGELDNMYRTMTDNVKGSVDRLNSAWQDFILSLSNSKGPIKWVIDRLTDIVTLINKGVTGFKSDKIQEKIDAKKREWLDLGLTPEEMGEEVQYREARMSAARERDASKKELKRLAEEVLVAYEAMKELTQEVKDDAVGGFGGTTTTPEDDALKHLLEETEKQRKKEEAEKASAKALRDYVEEAQGAADAEAELAERAQKMLDEYRLMHPAIKDTTRELIGFSHTVAALVEQEQEGTLGAGKMKDALDELRGVLGSSVLTDEEAEKLVGLDTDTLTAELDAVIEDQQNAADRMKEIWEDAGEEVNSVIRRSMISAFEELAEAIGTGNWDTSSMVRALLNPIADLAINLGTIVMTSGEAMKALNDALKSMGENPIPAMVVGAALVGVGMAAKMGIAALAKSSGGGASGNNGYSYTGGYGVTPAMLQQNTGTMEISVSGVLKGQDIFLASENYQRNKGR